MEGRYNQRARISIALRWIGLQPVHDDVVHLPPGHRCDDAKNLTVRYRAQRGRRCITHAQNITVTTCVLHVIRWGRLRFGAQGVKRIPTYPLWLRRCGCDHQGYQSDHWWAPSLQ